MLVGVEVALALVPVCMCVYVCVFVPQPMQQPMAGASQQQQLLAIQARLAANSTFQAGRAPPAGNMYAGGGGGMAYRAAALGPRPEDESLSKYKSAARQMDRELDIETVVPYLPKFEPNARFEYV